MGTLRGDGAQRDVQEPKEGVTELQTGQSPDFQQQGVKRKEFLLNPQRPRKRLCWNSLFLKLPF